MYVAMGLPSCCQTQIHFRLPKASPSYYVSTTRMYHRCHSVTEFSFISFSEAKDHIANFIRRIHHRSTLLAEWSLRAETFSLLPNFALKGFTWSNRLQNNPTQEIHSNQ